MSEQQDVRAGFKIIDGKVYIESKGRTVLVVNAEWDNNIKVRLSQFSVMVFTDVVPNSFEVKILEHEKCSRCGALLEESCKDHTGQSIENDECDCDLPIARIIPIPGMAM